MEEAIERVDRIRSDGCLRDASGSAGGVQGVMMGFRSEKFRGGEQSERQQYLQSRDPRQGVA